MGIFLIALTHPNVLWLDGGDGFSAVIYRKRERTNFVTALRSHNELPIPKLLLAAGVLPGHR